MTIDLSGRVAIVTGAGGGLGRAHALLLARRGAKVVVNDLGGARDGSGGSLTAAEGVVEEIVANGGQACANGASVTDMAEVEKMVADTLERWGRIDILVNNAGILRDKTFAKQDLADFRAVIDVHFMGSVHCTKAVWNVMREQGYGRIVLTTSSSGLYGNFGQSAYSAAKLALVGLMQTLRLEGTRSNICVNCLSPSAATRMTNDVHDSQTLDAMGPAMVSPAMIALVADDAPNGMVICAGAGSYEQAHITLTQGLVLGGEDTVPEQILSRIAEIGDRTDEHIPVHGPDQALYEVRRAAACGSNAAAA